MNKQLTTLLTAGSLCFIALVWVVTVTVWWSCTESDKPISAEDSMCRQIEQYTDQLADSLHDAQIIASIDSLKAQYSQLRIEMDSVNNDLLNIFE